MDGILEKPRGNLPEINFVEHNLADIVEQAAQRMEAYIGETIPAGDIRRIISNALCETITQALSLTDIAAKKGLLSYATGSYLDHIAELFGIIRPSATAASCSVVFTRSDTSYSEDIPAGVQVAGGGYLWNCTAIHFNFGETTSRQAVAVCETAGAAANGLPNGTINAIVAPSQVLKSVQSISVTSGGRDAMPDDEFVELIQSGSDALSVAGPIHAYEYLAKSSHPDITDVSVVSPSAGSVNIYLLKSGGVPPVSGEGIIEAAQAACSAETVRPVGDRVTVSGATPVNYSFVGRYNLSQSTIYAAGSEDAAKERIQAAAQAYQVWQRAKIGRDLSAGELSRFLMDAGAADVTVLELKTQYENRVIGNNQVANCTNFVLIYAGIVD